MRVTAGDVYYLLINKWDAGGAGFSINWGLSNGASIACPTILPIELLNFDAVFNGKSVDLNWTTATEINNDYFIVERSEDGINYSKLSIVPSKALNGNSQSKLYYTLNDPDIKSGIYYYRLKQVDIGDSKYKLSIIKSVVIVNENDIFSVVPNPTANSADVIYYCYSNEKSILRVYDNTGRLIQEKDVICEKGQNKSSISLESESEGLYIITLTTSNKIFKTKLVKQN
jgi:hypothetical protein